jgi:uracil-DNA glycosylase family 4
MSQLQPTSRDFINKHPLADCQNCSLRDRPHVPTKTPQGGADIAVIGEKPGYTEVLAQEPYVGQSGKLIKEVLRGHGIDAKQCLLTNAVSCWPEDDANPPDDAIKACKPRLIHELERSGVQRVLATGNFAARSLLQTTDGILEVRVGPPRTAKLPSGKSLVVVPTIHPAYVLRTHDAFTHLITDTGKLTAPPLKWEHPKFKVADTERKALAYIRFLENFNNFAVDIETDFDKDVAFEHPDDTDILCVGVAYDKGHVVVFPGEILRIPIVGKLFGLLLAGARLIAQFGQFDIPVLAQFHPDIRLAADTLLEHYILDERVIKRLHSLEHMAMELLGTSAWKWMTKQFTQKGQSFGAVPRDVLYFYNSIDCGTTYALDELFMPQLERLGLLGLHEFLLRASTALMQVEREGVSVDLSYLEKLDALYTAKLATLVQPLQQWVENPNSPKQVRSALARLGIDCPSTNVRTLLDVRKGMAQHDVPEAAEVTELIERVLEYRKVAKLHSTYVEGLRKRLHQGRVHTSYLLHGTSTGRLSSRNPNLQNQPRGPEVRRLFVPSHPDNVFIKADYAQGEWRVVTILADEPYFAERFRGGRDVAADLQEELFGNRIDKTLRTLTKNIAYGSWYGMILGRGDQGLYYANHILRMDPDVAHAYQVKLFQLAPKILAWQKATRQRVLDGEVLTTYKKRRRHFRLIIPQNQHEVMNECLAFIPQSTLSDMCLTALCSLVERGYKVRLSTHDEIVVECHADDAERISFEMAGIMSDAAKEFSTELPFTVETSVGRSWGDC